MASDIDVCSRCSDNFIINNKFSTCKLCENKFHLNCVSLKDLWHRVLSDNINLTWVCDNCVGKMKVAIDYVNSPEFNNMEIIKMEIQYISKEKILLEKLLSEMEYTISVQKKLITSYEGRLRSSLFDDEVGKQSEPGDTRADKDDNIPGISMLNKFHVESPKKRKSSKIIASTVTDDPTVSSKAVSNASYAQTTATGYQSKENKINAHDVNKAIVAAKRDCNLSESQDKEGAVSKIVKKVKMNGNK
ncbi:hypothetical protein WA026_019707 [Henosepilachna vigintioctopunctata]|uniref:PHD-type domain-containing protein n=1 Tax=Henosepilachna vigintioctopunctata TaxID=420089 RepID=A0AAW1UM84_9CUCU